MVQLRSTTISCDWFFRQGRIFENMTATTLFSSHFPTVTIDKSSDAIVVVHTVNIFITVFIARQQFVNENGPLEKIKNNNGGTHLEVSTVCVAVVDVAVEDKGFRDI